MFDEQMDKFVSVPVRLADAHLLGSNKKPLLFPPYTLLFSTQHEAMLPSSPDQSLPHAWSCIVNLPRFVPMKRRSLHGSHGNPVPFSSVVVPLSGTTPTQFQEMRIRLTYRNPRAIFRPRKILMHDET